MEELTERIEKAENEFLVLIGKTEFNPVNNDRIRLDTKLQGLKIAKEYMNEIQGAIDDEN